MSHCVLVVEDEALVNMFTSSELRVAGYEVLAAFDADEAIRILEKRNDIDLVFTDIDMPGSMDGLKLAAAIRVRWPPIRILLTTGMVAPTPEQMPAGSAVILKPYEIPNVLKAMQAITADGRYGSSADMNAYPCDVRLSAEADIKPRDISTATRRPRATGRLNCANAPER
jgi:CheY-like chemotaxis protein